MLATRVREPFHKPAWIHEEKYDGDRILAYKEGDRIRLMTRNDIDRHEAFPRIAATIQSHRPLTLLLDGKIVLFNKSKITRMKSSHSEICRMPSKA